MKRTERWRIWATGLTLVLTFALLAGALKLSDVLRSSKANGQNTGQPVTEAAEQPDAGKSIQSDGLSSQAAAGTATQSVMETEATGTQELPSVYDLTAMGKKPTVRSQGNTGTCWALSSVSALESDLLPETELVFSADHMSMNNGYTLTQEDGGDYYMIMSYLSDWKGPVLEEEDPYGDGVSPEGLSAAVHVQEVRLLKGMTQDEIKRAILECGAAQSSLSMDRDRTDTDEYHFYNAQTSAYFDPLMEDVSHDILVLGWDDDFSRENFRIKPRQDGAWICQNTWGESFGNEGIFYVSYEDKNLFRKGGVVYSRIESAANYDHVYENDSLGWQGRQGYKDDNCWFAGAFTAKSEEVLSAVGLYSTGPGTTCRIYVIPEFTGEEDLAAAAGSDIMTSAQTEDFDTTVSAQTEDFDTTASAQTGNFILVAQAQMDAAGFYTVDLQQKINLKAGQQFAVAVWIRTENETKPVVVEMEKDRFTQSVTFEGRQTWISPDGDSWENTQTGYLTNVCLKAYTSDDQVDDQVDNQADDQVDNQADDQVDNQADDWADDQVNDRMDDQADSHFDTEKGE